MTPVKRQPTLIVPPPPPDKRTYHEHTMIPHGKPLHQGMESNIKRRYQRNQPEAIYQELDDIHLNDRNWNHEINQQNGHISEEILALEEDNIDWDDDDSGSEDDLPSEMEDLGIESWSEDDDDQTDTIRQVWTSKPPNRPRLYQRHIPSISSIRVSPPTLAPKKPRRHSMR